MDITFTLQSITDGSLITGATGITVYISKDGGSFAATTNAAAEVGRGAYKVTLTSAEAAFSTLIYAPVCTGAQSNIYQLDAAPAVPTAADNATAVWGALTKEVTIATAQADTFATASSVANIATVAAAIKAKTDNLPTSPAAVGSEMALTSAAVSAVQNGLSTFNASTDTVTLNATEDGTLTAIKTKVDTLTNTDLTGIATSTDVSNAQTAIIARGNEAWLTATGFTVPGDLSGLATTEGLVYNLNLLTQHGNTYWVTATGFATPSDIPSTQDIWEYPDRELTSEISVDISAQNIADITESVWEAPDRTLTDMKPKPNQKNITCTPSNVINAYGVPRLENWTNETAGTQAFDDKINTYITLAKEKMTTDLNNHINAAIAYIGADNITELCAWLTGYNLYQDDESTDTDSLPETRYNQYLEQIHRIMENI